MHTIRTPYLHFWTLCALLFSALGAHAQQDYDGLRLTETEHFLCWDSIADDQCVQLLYIDASHGAMERNLWYEYYLRGAHQSFLPMGSVHRLRDGETLRQQMDNMYGAARKPMQDLVPMVSIEDVEGVWSEAQTRDSLYAIIRMIERYYGRSPVICYRASQASVINDSLRIYFRCMTDCDSLPTDSTIALWQDRAGRLHRVAAMYDLYLRYPREAYFAFDDSLPDGIDVSKYQKTIQWDKLRPYHLRYAFVRATLGDGNEDPNYQQNIAGAHRIGLMVGAYHYFNTKKSARAQFFWYYRHVKKSDINLPPMLDVEECKNWKHERLRDSINVWVALCEQYYGCKPIIYTYQNFYNDHLHPYYHDCLLFLAKYSSLPPTMYTEGHGQLWQYSCEGQLDGIPALVDLSKLHVGFRLEDYLITPLDTK